jgi:molybdopterin converting factor small subunit
MRVTVRFFSYFKDLAGCAEASQEIPQASTLGDLVAALTGRFPRLGAVKGSMLLAVGVDYQDRGYVLKPGDEVSLFPPVQGG